MNECGLLTIYQIENIALKGRMPSEQLVEVESAYYQELRVGVTRLYAALGANRQIDALLRVFNTDVVVNGMVVIPEDDYQYQVEAIQKNIGQDSIDITLKRVDEYYEIFSDNS